MNDEKLIKRLAEKLKEGYKILDDCFFMRHTLSESEILRIKKWFNSVENILRLRFGINSIYYQNCVNYIQDDEDMIDGKNFSSGLAGLESTLEAMKEGLTDDLFFQREMLLFSDFLDQAYEFLKHKHRVASAIYGRIALETAIREYANNKGMKNTDITFDQLIIQMKKEGIITVNFEKSLLANYDIGSMAAHGDKEFDDITDKGIEEYLSFIRDKVLTLA
jgi:hypothetical protein